MTEIRIARENEREELKKLWEHCFCDGEPFISFRFGSVFNTYTVVAAVNENGIVGALHMKEFALFSFGKKYKAFYICGFGVAEEERKKGIGRKILEYAHEFCKNQDADFVFLLPDINGYYEKFGYVPVSETVIYEIAPTDIKFGYSGGVKKFRNADGLDEIYGKYAAKYDVYLSRSMEECCGEYSLYDGGIFGTDGRGYVVYTHEKEKIEVFETAYTDDETLHTLLGFLKSISADNEKIIIHAAPDDDIKKIFYGKGIKKNVDRGIMAKPLKNIDPESIFEFCGGKSFINIF